MGWGFLFRVPSNMVVETRAMLQGIRCVIEEGTCKVWSLFHGVWSLFYFCPWSLFSATLIRKVWCSCHFNTKSNVSFVFRTENSTCHFDLQATSAALVIFHPRDKRRVEFWTKVIMGSNFMNGHGKK